MTAVFTRDDAGPASREAEAARPSHREGLWASVKVFPRPHLQGDAMLLIRDIMYCKPGKVRAMVEKFVAMAKLGEKRKMPKMRVMTDLSAERYWTVVSEMEVESMESFMAMMQNPDDAKEFDAIMKGYHDLVESGRREIYTIEA
jgi:hypothetical protein